MCGEGVKRKRTLGKKSMMSSPLAGKRRMDTDVVKL